MKFSKTIPFSLCICFFLSSCGEVSKKQEVSKPVEVQAAPKQLPYTRKEITLSFAPVVKKVAPAVVNIYATQHATEKPSTSPLMADPFFKQFFDRFYGDDDTTREHNALGSGIIVSKEGLVLTNYHVIKGADEIRVALSDKREFKAQLIAVDKKMDLGLLQIQAKEDFPFLTVGPQEDLEVGDLVLAIGNPFGVGQAVTSGIVSALARSQKGINDFRMFIQTDAAINPGNSGGPLVTTDGRLVGINTAIFSTSGGYMGIGFATPIVLAIPILESVDKGGKIVRPWIGLEVESPTAESVDALGLSHSYGVVVTAVYPKGPADKAGIKVGDFIAAFNGHEVEDDTSFDYQIAVSPLGQKADLTLLRKGKEDLVPVLLTEPIGSQDSKPLLIEGVNPLQGVKIQTLSPALALELGLDSMQQGVVVTEVLKSSSALQVGFQTGDIIAAINKKKVKTQEEVAELLQQKVPAWDLVLRRGDKLVKLRVVVQ
jgi:serine protease Do